jgi:hypothetical protein
MLVIRTTDYPDWLGTSGKLYLAVIVPHLLRLKFFPHCQNTKIKLCKNVKVKEKGKVKQSHYRPMGPRGFWGG